MQVAEDESVLMSKEEAIDKITTFTGGRLLKRLSLTLVHQEHQMI